MPTPPFTARRLDGKLILEIDEHAFLAEAFRDAADNLRVVDREQFLRFALVNMFTLTHDLERDGARTSWWTRLVEALGKAAAANNAGVRHLPPLVPACGCNPEDHDGG